MDSFTFPVKKRCEILKPQSVSVLRRGSLSNSLGARLISQSGKMLAKGRLLKAVSENLSGSNDWHKRDDYSETGVPKG